MTKGALDLKETMDRYAAEREAMNAELLENPMGEAEAARFVETLRRLATKNGGRFARVCTGSNRFKVSGIRSTLIFPDMVAGLVKHGYARLTPDGMALYLIEREKR